VAAEPVAPASHAAARFRSLAPVLVAWVLLTTLTSLPYLRASLSPPPGRTFLGFLFWIEDAYVYLSYVEQAERGAFLFENRLRLEDHRPALVNLEWWSVGFISRLLGGRPLLAYRVFGAGAALLLLLGADLWLRRCGLPESHRFAALLLVFTGGGLGGVRYEIFGPPAWASLDMVSGLYPFIELLANPHFVIGTALLLFTLLAFDTAGWRGGAAGALVGTALGLTRPYDLAVAVAVRAAQVAVTRPPSRWPAGLAPVLGLAPVSAYVYWIHFRDPRFATFRDVAYQPPPLADVLIALAPALLLAAAVWRPSKSAPGEARRATAHLLVWPAVALAAIAFPLLQVSLQVLVGVGLPVLALAALGLSRRPVAATLAAALAMSSTAVLTLRIALRDEPRWMAPTEQVVMARALRRACEPGDRVLAPPEVGLYALGLSACKPYCVPLAQFEGCLATVDSFYVAATPAERSALLDRACITHLVLPHDPGPSPSSWLGDTSFGRLATVGLPPRMSLYERRIETSCRPQR
jgi:hypothetical protein